MVPKTATKLPQKIFFNKTHIGEKLSYIDPAPQPINNTLTSHKNISIDTQHIHELKSRKKLIKRKSVMIYFSGIIKECLFQLLNNSNYVGFADKECAILKADFFLNCDTWQRKNFNLKR
jgi:hypothetical protein